MTNRVLIAGAGYLGMALAERMQGAQLFLARRSPIQLAGMTSVLCDFSDITTLQGLPEVDLVYYSVAADGPGDESYARAYDTGIKNLLEIYRHRNVKPHIVYSSSTSVYSEDQGGFCSEDSELVSKGSSRFMVAGEKRLLDSGLAVSILRYGGIYGPGRTRFLQSIVEGKEVLTPSHPYFMNRIFQADAVKLVEFLHRNQHYGVFNGVDVEASLRDEVILWVAQKLGVDSSRFPRQEAPLSRGHKRVSSEKIKKLGYSFEVPSYREGLERLQCELRL